MNMVYKASKDMTVQIMTIGVVILFAFLGYKSIIGLINSNGNITPILIHSSVIVFLFGTLLLCFLYAPKGYSINEDKLVIHRPLNDKYIPIDSMIEIRPINKSEMKGTIRTFGVGGLFGNYGKFHSNGLGNFTMFGTQSKNYVLIKTSSKKFVITPDEIEIVEQIKALKTASL